MSHNFSAYLPKRFIFVEKRELVERILLHQFAKMKSLMAVRWYRRRRVSSPESRRLHFLGRCYCYLNIFKNYEKVATFFVHFFRVKFADKWDKVIDNKYFDV